MSTNRIKASIRNRIIEDYRNGIVNSDYVCIPSKTKGRYTIRARKTPLTPEQCEELSANMNVDGHTWTSSARGDDTGDVDIEPQAPRTQQQPQTQTQIKKSKKENSLFELQNQLNSQLMYRVNDLTNQVSKMKEWKKYIKRNFDLNVDDINIDDVVDDNNKSVDTQEQAPKAQPSPVPDKFDYVDELDKMESQQQEQPEETMEYEQIPYGRSPEAYMPNQQPVYQQRRGRIDYSKFGF